MTTITIKKETLKLVSSVLLFMAFIFFSLIGVSFTTNFALGANVTNKTVISKVNVTNTEPNITAIVVSPSLIDLTANGDTVVTCNATVFDYNGWQDINANATNATFYIQSVGENVAADNNHRYVNSSCGDCIQQPGSTNATCACRVALKYYANDSSTWRCNMTVRDFGGTQKEDLEINLTDSEISNPVTVTKLLAINTSTLLDYGNLSVTQTSAEIIHNVTNAGNINFNLSLRGFGGDNESVGQNLSMICELGNISIGYQRYSLGTNNGSPYTEMKNLTNQTFITNLTLPARVDDLAPGSDRNSTFWRLQIPLTVGGICNGTIIFGAVDGET